MKKTNFLPKIKPRLSMVTSQRFQRTAILLSQFQKKINTMKSLPRRHPLSPMKILNVLSKKEDIRKRDQVKKRKRGEKRRRG